MSPQMVAALKTGVYFPRVSGDEPKLCCLGHARF